VVTAGVQSELKSLHATNSAITHEIAAQLGRGTVSQSAELQGLGQANSIGLNRQLTAWQGGKLLLNAKPSGINAEPLQVPSFAQAPFESVVREHGALYLRCVDAAQVRGGTLTVVSSELFDQAFLEKLAADLGEITLYASGFSVRNLDQSDRSDESGSSGQPRRSGAGRVLETNDQSITPEYTAGSVPSATNAFDRQVTFATSISVVDWHDGTGVNPAALSVQTRLSMLYKRLFAALGEFAPAVEFVLVAMALVFAVIELAALIIGVGLSRTITGSIFNLYRATQSVNKGDFSHRIAVTSDDQLAALENSFNSMTASLQRLLAEQKEKQRL
jgi:sigma-B regulation protein RsbU (phosphoserine phosphatase)